MIINIRILIMDKNTKFNTLHFNTRNIGLNVYSQTHYKAKQSYFHI